jgi:hypothetical protein
MCELLRPTRIFLALLGESGGSRQFFFFSFLMMLTMQVEAGSFEQKLAPTAALATAHVGKSLRQ